MQPKLKWECPRCDVSFQFYREEFLCTFIELHRVEHDLKDKGLNFSNKFEAAQVRQIEEMEENAVSELEKADRMMQRLPDTLLPKDEDGRIDFSRIREMDIYDDNYDRWNLSNEDKSFLQGLKISC